MRPRLSITPTNLRSFWPLLLIVVLLAAVVAYLSPQNLKILPYKALIVCLAMYIAHRYDERAFSALTRKLDDAVQRSFEPENGSAALVAYALVAVARALVYGFTVVAMAIAL